jgi:TPP-dependent pyruvate/acetoin dehydrogenase alpha subunit
LLPPFTEEPFSILDAPDPAPPPDLNADDLRRLYALMVRTRTMDEKAAILVRQGKTAFYAASAGQEAAQVGSAYPLQPQDWIFPAHRELGCLLTRGLSMEEMFGQLMAKMADPCKGHQMPVHFGSRPLRVVPTASTVGNHLPEAVGAGYAAKLRKEPAVAVAYCGEGATSEGDFHAAMNFAGVLKTPTIFVVQNNQYAISVPRREQTASRTIAAKAAAYGFDGFYVDGNDVLAVYAAMRQVVDRARGGGGPALIEAVTYRYAPHSSADDDKLYRREEEVKEWRERRDPLRRFRAFLLKRGEWTEEQDRALQDQAKVEVDAAADRAEASPDPPPETLFEDVYATPLWIHEQERAALQRRLARRA